MTRNLLNLLVVILLFSCKPEKNETVTTTKTHTPRTISTVNIKSFKQDSISIRAIHAINDSTLYFAGSNGYFGYTKDNGKTWHKQQIRYQDSIIPSFRSIAFNGKDFFVLSVATPALLYKITNKTVELVYQETHEKVFYDSMHFFDDNLHGIAVGDPTATCPSVILTNDGGKTWTKLACDKLPSFEDGEAFFAASNTNIKTIGSTVWMASGGKKSRILKSTDYGNTWQIFDTPIVQGDGPQGMYTIDFADKNNGIALGGNYAKPLDNCANKAITKDGGNTWQLIADNVTPNYRSCVQYVPNTTGQEIFAVGKTGVAFSNDGGKTWTQVSDDSYYSIQFVDKHTAWLSGHKKIGKLVF